MGSAGRAGAVISLAEMGDSASSTGAPKMKPWSSTKEVISGAGTLSVGANTMPTAMMLVVRIQ